MKRFFLLCLTALFALTTWAYSFYDETSGFYYNIIDGGVEVTWGGSSQYVKTPEYTGDLIIPSSIQYGGNTYTVIGIGDFAFNGCDITSLEIPNTVTTIGWGSIGNSTTLTSLELPNSITTIGMEAFEADVALEEIYIPEGVTSIGEWAFASCSNLKSLVFPNSVTVIGERMCSSCLSLKDVTIGNAVTSIGDQAFMMCSSLNKIYFRGSTPPTFGTGDFLGDSETIYVPIGSLSAYETAFAGQTYTAIKEFAEIDIVVADSENDGYATFYHGTYDITLPDGVKAYYASKVEDGEVTLTEVAETIPAGNAVLVEGSIADYYMDATAATSETTLEGNMLYGSDTDTETTVDGTTSEGYYFYKLSTVKGENLGFYWGAEDGGKFSIAAHKAWLAVPTTEGTRALSFKKGDTDTTGITSVEVENEANAVSGIYTLQGVRVSDMSQKGVYIVNGKKVLVK